MEFQWSFNKIICQPWAEYLSTEKNRKLSDWLVLTLDIQGSGKSVCLRAFLWWKKKILSTNYECFRHNTYIKVIACIIKRSLVWYQLMFISSTVEPFPSLIWKDEWTHIGIGIGIGIRIRIHLTKYDIGVHFNSLKLSFHLSNGYYWHSNIFIHTSWEWTIEKKAKAFAQKSMIQVIESQEKTDFHAQVSKNATFI